MSDDERAARVARWLIPEAIAVDVDAPDAERLVRAAATVVTERCTGLDAAQVFRALWRREQAGSTALGVGVAVPHARIDGIDRPTVFYLRTRYAIEFGAPDGKPVVHFLVIVVPTNGDVDEHLELLARVSQLFSDRAFRERLAMADGVGEVRGVFADASIVRP